MFWDSGFDSWDHFGVTGQPAAILLDPAGNKVGSWSGFLDTKKVLATLSRVKSA